MKPLSHAAGVLTRAGRIAGWDVADRMGSEDRAVKDDQQQAYEVVGMGRDRAGHRHGTAWRVPQRTAS